jgi:hypothetical protein
MFTRTLVAILALCTTSLQAFADDSDTTESLYQQHCVSCHGSEIYTRTDRKISSFDGLQRQVQRCELALGLKWFDEEITDMTAYLNEHYYHFEP